MSKLQDLIADISADGVKYVKLRDCCMLERGKTPIQKAVSGQYPLVVTTYERKSCNTFQFDSPAVCIPLVSSRGHGVASLTQIYYQEGKFALGNILCAVIPNDENVLSAKFLYYYLSDKKDKLIVPLMRGGANVSLTVDSLGSIKIPLPAIQIQNEIAYILSRFSDLNNMLTAELAARQKQYEYYRDKLLTFNNEEIAPPPGKIWKLNGCYWATYFIHATAIRRPNLKMNFGKAVKFHGFAWKIFGRTDVFFLIPSNTSPRKR